MRLLLDEMISASVAVELRARGHDVVAVQDPELLHLRGLDDCVLLARAADDRRAVVTDNIPDFMRCHRQRLGPGAAHLGLLFFASDTFPRHRHELFVSQLIAALEDVLDAHAGDDGSSPVRWLVPRSSG